MSQLTCPDVADRLELFAANECDAAEAEAIRRHLAQCAGCATACDEARQLVGLLDLRLQEPERLKRLAARIDEEAAPRPRLLRFPSGLRRVVALAAMLLLAVGPIAWLLPGLRPAEGDGGLVAVLREPDRRGGVEVMVAPAREAHLMMAKTTQPANVDLSLRLQNTSDRPMQVWVEGPLTELRFDVRGPGAVRRPVPDGEAARSRSVPLGPGEEITIPIHELVEGPPGARRAWYFTQPGNYTVTARFTTTAWSPGIGRRGLIVESAPRTIPVEGD